MDASESKTEDDLLTNEQAARRLRLSPQTLATWRCTGRQRIPFVKVGSLVRYRVQDIDEFLARQLRVA